jgi:fructose-1-phosphate kinase PfkB-like protein
LPFYHTNYTFTKYDILFEKWYQSSNGWIDAQTAIDRVNVRSMYALSGVLTKPGGGGITVPEPTSVLGFITLGGLMLGGAVRKARK